MSQEKEGFIGSIGCIGFIGFIGSIGFIGFIGSIGCIGFIGRRFFRRADANALLINPMANKCAIGHLIVPLTVERKSEILHFSLYECCATFCN